MSNENGRPGSPLITPSGRSALRGISRRRLIGSGLALAGAAAMPGLLTGRALAQPVSGGKLTLGTVFPFRAFDPFLSQLVNFPSFQTCYSWLIKAGHDMVPQPDLAESWEMADDNKSVVIRLRPAQFHSGKPVTADDLLGTIARALDPKQTNSLHGTTVILVKDAVKLGEREVRINLTQAFPETTVTDWMMTIPIIEADKNNPDALVQEPAGSGPFMLAENVPGVRMVLRKNPNYWEPGKPYLDELEFQFFESQNALVAALQTGGIDGALFVTASLVRPLEMDFDIVSGFRGAQIGVMYIQADKPPFDNKKLRQAMLHSVNRARVVRDAYFGRSEPAFSVFGPVSPASLPEYNDKAAYDLERARQLIAESGGAKTATVSIPASDPARFQVAQIMQADLATIGFDLQINSADQTTFAADFRGGRNHATMSATGNSGKTPWRVTSDAALSTGSTNFLWGGSPPAAWAEAVAQARDAISDDDRLASYRRMNEVLLDEAWIIPMNVWQNTFVFAKKVHGVATDPRDMYNFTDTYIS